MSFLDEVKADCLEAETDLGSKTMTWKGGIYPVAASLAHKDITLIIGGQELNIVLTLRVRWNGPGWQFDTLPEAGQLVTYSGTIYRIAKVSNAHSTFIEILLEDRNK